MTGDTFPTWLVTYNHEGKDWGLELLARDKKDAEARLKRIGYGKIDGELIAKIPAFPGGGWLMGALCAVRNAFK